MEIQLSPEMQKFVDQKLASGDFASASEVIHTALALLQFERPFEGKELEYYREQLKGIEDLEDGDYEPLDMEAIKQEVRDSVRHQPHPSKHP
jgi:antitoxin ParD1/3/4